MDELNWLEQQLRRVDETVSNWSDAKRAILLHQVTATGIVLERRSETKREEKLDILKVATVAK